MSRKQRTQAPDFVQKIKKFFLSAFVIFTFFAYFLHERYTNSANASASNTAAITSAVPTVVATSSANASASNTAAITTAVPTVIATSQGVAFKNGTYTGPVVDAYYGLVQVQVAIQNGKIANVQFLDYPHDRRTSQQINNQVMPWLVQEAIQAQSANVDIISGATLTSEAFATSLQSALQSAKN
ncbi:MAG: FMN-binding protein [Anaerolineales bacterium]|jgi:uncharacterized protein with FMN-binding domain